MALQALTKPEFTRILSTFPLVPRARESRRARGVSGPAYFALRLLMIRCLPSG